MTWQITIWAQSQAGSRAGKTRHHLQWWDIEFECNVGTAAGLSSPNSTFAAAKKPRPGNQARRIAVRGHHKWVVLGCHRESRTASPYYFSMVVNLNLVVDFMLNNLLFRAQLILFKKDTCYSTEPCLFYSVTRLFHLTFTYKSNTRPYRF